jgi:hypothetical protein
MALDDDESQEEKSAEEDPSRSFNVIRQEQKKGRMTVDVKRNRNWEI